MKNLSDFANEEIEDIKGKSDSISNDLEHKINEYSRLSENELLQKLFDNVEKQKQDGSFDFNQLASMFNTIRPYLSSSQQNNIEELLKKIK